MAAFVLLLDLSLLPLIHASLPLATDNGDEAVLASVDMVGSHEETASVKRAEIQ